METDFMQYVKAVCVVLLNLAGLLVSAQSFELNTASDGKGDSGYWTKWDSTHNRLLMYRDSSSPDTPSARVLSGSGTSVPIFILHDFRDAKFADIWAAAATPEGGMILSVVIGFGDRPTPETASSKPIPPAKVFLLTYGPDGALKKVWNVAPYLHEALAVDPSGNVFALGTRDAGPEGFPMLIKYSPAGSVLGEFVSSKMFANGDKVLKGSPVNGPSGLFLRNQQLLLWVSSSREAFRLSLTGDLRRKIAVGSALDRLAVQNGFAQATIAELALDDSGGLLLQVRFWPSKTSLAGMMLGMVSIPSDGSEAKLVGPLTAASSGTQHFLGIAEDGKNVVIEHAGNGRAL